jgi:hypothetical protein
MTTTTKLTLEEITTALAELGFIADLWHIEDVQHLRPDLTDPQAWSVLQDCNESRDANIGIHWNVIRIHASVLFPESVSELQQAITPRYEVQTAMLSAWENCWTDDDGNPVTFDTRDDAAAAIADHINDCLEAVRNGDLIDAPELDSFRIVEKGRS